MTDLQLLPDVPKNGNEVLPDLSEGFMLFFSLG